MIPYLLERLRNIPIDATADSDSDSDRNATEAIEFNWIKGLIDQILFADKALRYHTVRLVVKKYCDCYPNCFDSDSNSGSGSGSLKLEDVSTA